MRTVHGCHGRISSRRPLPCCRAAYSDTICSRLLRQQCPRLPGLHQKHRMAKDRQMKWHGSDREYRFAGWAAAGQRVGAAHGGTARMARSKNLVGLNHNVSWRVTAD